MTASRAQDVCDALVTLLDAADDAEEFNETLNAARVWTTLTDMTNVGDTIVAQVAPQLTKRTRDSNSTYLRYVVIDILLRIHLTNDATADRTTMDNRARLAEQIDDYLADPDNSELTLTDASIAEYVEPTDTRADGDITGGLGILWVSEDLDGQRQVTVLVRVAYRIDEDY